MVGTHELAGSLELHAGWSDPVQAGSALYLILVHDGDRVRVWQAVLVSQPRCPLGMPHEGRSRLQSMEPLPELAASDPRNAGDQVLVRLRGVDQGQRAPPGRETPESSLHYLSAADKTSA